MNGRLAVGTSLSSVSGSVYTIKKMLGSGRQGEVYEVQCDGKTCALKWLFPEMATDGQKRVFEIQLQAGSPDKSFLWPQDIIAPKPGELGYTMSLIPSEYKNIVDLVTRRAEPSFTALCRAAFNMTKGYRNLHAKGFCYRDINLTNLSFNPDTGETLICDCDNVSHNAVGYNQIGGTMPFMAPEIVRDEAEPSRNTDLHSLAVLLFHMFMINHPLEGKLEAAIKCWDEPAQKLMYGRQPLFIYDPNDQRNCPEPGRHDNAMIYWGLYPKSIKDLFVASFTEGLHHPGRRVTEKQWLDVLVNMLFGIISCPGCKAEVFFDETNVSAHAAHTCWNCKKSVPVPPSLVADSRRVLLSLGTQIFSHHLADDYDLETIVGTVTAHPADPKRWGIRNDSRDNWTYIRADGTQTPIEPGKTAQAGSGVKIHFGKSVGAFI